MKRISLIHATPFAMEPIHTAFKTTWPEAELVNVLDDSLSKDRNQNSEQEDYFNERIKSLCDYAKLIKSDGIIYTCSAFGKAIETASEALVMPVLKPNEAMFEAAMDLGEKVGMVATFKPAVEGMEQEFEETKRRLGKEHITLKIWVAEDGRHALDKGDVKTHDEIILKAIEEMPECDVYMLAHFSTSTAYKLIKSKTNKKILTSPESAVEKLKKILT